MSENDAALPLTSLSEDEQFFYDTIKNFANDKIRPLVRQMDEAAQLDQSLIPQFFEMGLMGIDVAEEYGGAETSFFMATLAIEALSTVDASAATIIDVQNTLE